MERWWKLQRQWKRRRRCFRYSFRGNSTFQPHHRCRRRRRKRILFLCRRHRWRNIRQRRWKCNRWDGCVRRRRWHPNGWRYGKRDISRLRWIHRRWWRRTGRSQSDRLFRWRWWRLLRRSRWRKLCGSRDWLRGCGRRWIVLY